MDYGKRFAEQEGLRNLAERNGMEVVDHLLKVQTALHHLLEQEEDDA